MTLGMLWFDNSKDALPEKIRRASEYYEKKYGQKPTFCYIHPTMVVDKPIQGINIYTSRQVLPNHFWLGVEEKA